MVPPAGVAGGWPSLGDCTGRVEGEDEGSDPAGNPVGFATSPHRSETAVEKPTRDRTRKAAHGRAARAKPLRARSGSRRTAPARKEAPAVPGGAAATDDTVITALELQAAPLSPAMAAYFEKCREKLGFVPNVLKAYAFDMAKLEAFVAMYNDLMLAPSGLSKLEREMIAVAVSSHNRCYYCLVAHGAAVRQLSGDPVLGELMAMNYRAAKLTRRQRAMLDFAAKLTAEPWQVEEADRERLRKAKFSDRDIWDIAAVAGFFNMTNRVASATDMRPNRVYHGQARTGAKVKS
jgi:uncharacterized peroxidase-related enzyme